MRKKSPRKTAARKKAASRRRPKHVSQPRDAEGLRELATELRQQADRIDGYAEQMERMEIPSIRPLTGNFYQALEKIRVFTAQHILGRLVAQAERRGYDAHEMFRK